MNSTKLIGKIFAPRQREIDLYGTKAEEIQARVFRKLIQSASATEWGKKYDFSQIRNGERNMISAKSGIIQIFSAFLYRRMKM